MRRSQGGTKPLLRPLTRVEKVETLFVAVAGVGTEPPDEWTDNAGGMWLARIQAPGVRLLSYDHNITKSDPALWQSLLDHGQRLLQSLLSLIESSNLRHCPILLVAHSLGGYIVKEALRLAYEQTTQHYRSFTKSLAGVILMGTPHSISGEEDKWQRVALLPQVSGFIFKVQALDRDNIHRLTQSTLLFDQGGVVCPILTIAEARPTRVKQKFSLKRVMLVPIEFARTGSREETLLKIDSDHRNLCKVPNTTRVNEFINEGLEDARLRIVNDSPLSRLEVDELDEQEYDMADSNSNPTTTTTTRAPYTNLATAGSSDLGFEIVGTALPNIQLRVPVLPSYLFPVARNRHFFGRQQVLDQIDSFFPSAANATGEDGESCRSFALCGPGGIGKTQIVTEYAYRSRDAGTFEAIFWIYADEGSKLSEGIAQIAVSLNLVAADSPEALDPVITTNLTKEWLSNPARSANVADDQTKSQPRWLLVLDNVDDLQVLDGFWPIEGPGCVLITSRDPLAKDPAVLADSGCDVTPFRTDEASKLLGILTQRTEDGREVGDRLGGLPLSIVQMASVIIRYRMSFAEFVEAWDERQEHPEYFGTNSELQAPDTYNRNPSTVWAIDSLRHGRLLLEVVAFYDPDTIHESVLRQYSAIVLEHYPKNLVEYLKARRELLQTSLIKKDATEENISVHRIVQDATRSSMDKDRYRIIFSAALRLLVSAWPFEDFGWRHGITRWRKCDELFPHVLRLRGFGSHMANDLDLETKIMYCKLMNDAGWFYHETGHFVESQGLIENASGVAYTAYSLVLKASPDESSKATELADIIAETHHNLGCIGTETNQPKFTLSHFKKFNAMMLEQHNEKKPHTVNRLAISWNELGNAYMMNRLWQDGERCFKRCLEVARQMESFDPAEFSFPYVNLGLAYWLTDRLDIAKETLEEGLRHRVARYGHDDSQSFITGRFLYALGNVAASEGALGDSLRFHERALAQFLSTIGKNHHRTGDIRVKLAQHYLRLGEANKASDQINAAIKIFQERAIFRPELARATFWKSRILEATGEIDEAHKLRGQSLDMYSVISGCVISGEVSPADFDNLIAFWSR